MIRSRIDGNGQHILVVTHPAQDWVLAVVLLGIGGFFARPGGPHLSILGFAALVVSPLFIAALILRTKIVVGTHSVKERIVVWRNCALPVDIQTIRVAKRGKTFCLEGPSEEVIYCFPKGLSHGGDLERSLRLFLDTTRLRRVWESGLGVRGSGLQERVER